VHGTGEVTGRALVRHPDVDMVSFTGSSAVGAEIGEVCARTFKRICLEMGGKNALIVLDDADLEQALEGAAWSAFGTSGQRCTAASRIIVHAKLADDFAHELAKRAKGLKLGNHLKSKIDVGPIINRKQLDRVHDYIGIGKREGARILVGGEVASDGDLSRGTFYKPTVFTDTRPDMRIAQEEIFGPVTAVIKTGGFDEALKILHDVNYGLSCSLYTKDVNKALAYIKKARVGMVYLNSHTIGGEAHLPFGGFRMSGNGQRECGWTGMDVYSEVKTVYADYSQRLQRPMIER
jgi:aldehyde dehydrogenase (NAD+)